MERIIPRKCPECDGDDLWMSVIDSGTLRGPRLLPGLGNLLGFATMHVVMCRECGLVRFFASRSAMDKVASSSPWQRVREPETQTAPNE
jgi:hypothetical protein